MRILYFYTSFLICCSFINISLGVGKTGPYRTTLIRVEKCAKPERPYIKEPYARLDVKPYNDSSRINLIKGSLTVINKIKHFSVKFKAFYHQHGRWSLSRVYMPRCDGVMMAMLLKVAGMEYDSSTCTLDKGSAEFDSVDFNELDHIWAREREYGRMLWMFHYFMKDSTVICYEVENHIDPL